MHFNEPLSPALLRLSCCLVFSCSFHIRVRSFAQYLGVFFFHFHFHLYIHHLQLVLIQVFCAPCPISRAISRAVSHPPSVLMCPVISRAPFLALSLVPESCLGYTINDAVVTVPMYFNDSPIISRACMPCFLPCLSCPSLAWVTPSTTLSDKLPRPLVPSLA